MRATKFLVTTFGYKLFADIGNGTHRQTCPLGDLFIGPIRSVGFGVK